MLMVSWVNFWSAQNISGASQQYTKTGKTQQKGSIQLVWQKPFFTLFKAEIFYVAAKLKALPV